MAGEIESTPESVDVAGAVALMGDLAKDVGEEEKGERDADTATDGGDGDDAAVAEADEEAGEGEEPEEVAADEAPAEGSDAPEFWSAEDKAAWNAVPPELRPVLKKYEQQRVEFVNEKAREAATIRARAAEEVAARQRRGRSGRPMVAAGRPGAAAGLRRQVVPGQLDRARREEPCRMGAAQPDPHGRGGRSRRSQPARAAGHQGRDRSAPSRPSSTPSTSSTPSWRRSCPTISVRPRGAEDLRRARQVPVRQGHPGRPHQPDP